MLKGFYGKDFKSVQQSSFMRRMREKQVIITNMHTQPDLYHH